MRSPYENDAGYIASKKVKGKGWFVIYLAKEQGLDDTDGKYVVVCRKHGSILNVNNLKIARASMRYPDFCEYCTGVEKMSRKDAKIRREEYKIETRGY